MQDTSSTTPSNERCGKLMKVLQFLQCPVLLFIRVAYGFQFIIAGWGKITHLDAATKNFEGFGLPFPHLNAILASSTEIIGGSLLLVGLGSRIISIPLVFTMLVALATAHRSTFVEVFVPVANKDGTFDTLATRIDAFFGLLPIPFLCAALVILTFGPGRLSLDYLLRKVLPCRTKTVEVITKS